MRYFFAFGRARLPPSREFDARALHLWGGQEDSVQASFRNLACISIWKGKMWRELNRRVTFSPCASQRTVFDPRNAQFRSKPHWSITKARKHESTKRPIQSSKPILAWAGQHPVMPNNSVASRYSSPADPESVEATTGRLEQTSPSSSSLSSQPGMTLLCGVIPGWEESLFEKKDRPLRF